MAETNGNGFAKKWHIIASFLGMAGILATFLFRAGVVDANFDGRLTRNENDVKELQVDYARKDVIEQRLQNIEKTENRIEQEEIGQADILNKILLEQRRR